LALLSLWQFRTNLNSCRLPQTYPVGILIGIELYLYICLERIDILIMDLLGTWNVCVLLDLL
jgi:hypothetical protein